MKLSNYKGEYLFTKNKNKVILVGSDSLKEIKDYIAKGFNLYEAKEEKVFDKEFLACIRFQFEIYAEDNGSDDMVDNMDFENEEYKKVEEAIKNYIKSLGTLNDVYVLNENIKIILD